MGRQSVGFRESGSSLDSQSGQERLTGKLGLQVPDTGEHSRNHLSRSAFINLILCLWVRENHLLLIIILNKSKSGGGGKPTQSSFQKDAEKGGQRENTSEKKFIFSAQRQKTRAWSRATKTDPFKADPVFKTFKSSSDKKKKSHYSLLLMASPLYADR